MTKSPPYASTGDIESFFEKVEMLKAPKAVDAAWASAYLGSKQPPAIPTMLEWLGVLNDGVPSQEKWTELRSPDTRRKLLADAVLPAYSAVIEQLDVDKASRSDLDRAFVKAYGMGDPAKYVNCFVTLSRHAGLSVAAVSRAAARNDGERAKAPAPGSARRDRSVPRRVTRPVAFAVTLTIEIPAEWGPDEVRQRLETVRRALDEQGATG